MVRICLSRHSEIIREVPFKLLENEVLLHESIGLNGLHVFSGSILNALSDDKKKSRRTEQRVSNIPSPHPSLMIFNTFTFSGTKNILLGLQYQKMVSYSPIISMCLPCT